MNQNKIFKTMFLLLALSMLSCIAIAEQQGNLPIYGESAPSTQLRIISGGLCQDLPDDKGTPTTLDSKGQVWCTGPNGVTDDMTGCVAQFHDVKGRLLREDILAPGEHTTPAPVGTASWQRFNCFEVDYTCTDFQSKGCGGTGSYADCKRTDMLRVRSCSSSAPKSVETERCIPWTECYWEECDYRVGEWGKCTNGVQSRYIYEADCSTTIDTQSCELTCSSPSGRPGDLLCEDTGKKYECRANGNWYFIGVCDPSSSGSSEPTTTKKSKIGAGQYTAFFDPTKQVVIGRIELTNNGDNMIDTYLLEMQLHPKGERAFAFISDQKTCDPDFPENVHKNFMLKAGETEVVELQVPMKHLKKGKEYDVYFLTRHKCYNDLTQAQIDNYEDYQRVGPFGNDKKVATVFIGDQQEQAQAWLWKALPFVLMIIAIPLAYFIGPYALIPFGIGLLLFIIQRLLG